jgi:regulator of replication initiation timing
MVKKTDTTFSLERKGESDELEKDTATELEAVAPDLAAENAALKAENESLKVRLDSEMADIRAQLAGMQKEEDKPVAPGVPRLNMDLPHAKTRTSGGQVYFEQGGVKFNARGVMMVGPEQQG